ncbi:hypothetical protein KY338_03820 [Candidatus Woesearchaeota archaeon]|nr:hypothetical protein [Candidatus Woesearchaeota archaeon]MBW3005440.1 hypothetical protein [Candidatus Woesearchaeota archaeon]
MKLSKEYIAKCATAVLAFLDEKQITSLDDIKKISPSDNFLENGAHVLIQETPSGSFDSTAQTVSYVPPGEVGVPIEMKINGQKRYSVLIFKGDFSLPGYETFSQDPFGNNVHYRKIASIEIESVRSELEKLAE